ncbi:MAG TPA: hypothetical protein VGG40_12695 [Solirubrobacterales bacterium]|jgi:hypothetical protein
MQDRIGKVAVRYGARYLRRRYRREIRLGIAVGAATVVVAAYLGTRNVREG